MIPELTTQVAQARGIPRESGDDPRGEYQCTAYTQYSPRERG